MEKIKCWVVYSDEFQAGIVYDNRNDALDEAAEIRSSTGEKAYTRVKYFTKVEFESLPESD